MFIVSVAVGVSVRPSVADTNLNIGLFSMTHASGICT